MSEKKRVSPSLEDYLETIYFLKLENANVRVTDVAIALSISKPSVNKAINILNTQGYVDHKRYGLLNLTPKGFLLAQSIATCHVTIKNFLINVLNVNEDVAEKEACIMEHAMSLDTVSKLGEFMKKNNFK